MKILIVKLSALGDIVQSWGVLDYIKTKFPTAEIDWVVEQENSELIERHPLVSCSIPINTRSIRKNICTRNGWKELQKALALLRAKRYDYVFDLQGNIKSSLCVLTANGDNKVGWVQKECAEWPASFAYSMKISMPEVVSSRDRYLGLIKKTFGDESDFEPKSHLLELTLQEQSRLDEMLVGNKSDKPLWIVCPSSKWINKTYPLEKLFSSLNKLDEVFSPSLILISGGGSESKEIDSLKHLLRSPNQHLIRPSFPFLQHLMKQSCLVVGMDSVPLHLAASVDVPVFGLFGPSRFEAYFPKKHNRRVYQGTCPYGRSFDFRCPVLRSCATGACIRDVSPDDISSAIAHFLQP